MPSTPSTSRPSPDGLDLHTVAQALRRGWRLVAVATLATVLATALFTFLRSPVYRAEGVVLIDATARTSGSETMASLFTAGQAVRSLSNEVELLRQSDVLAGRVVARLADSSGAAERTPAQLREQVAFEPVSERVDMIRISAESQDPRLAARIVNEYTEVYRERGRETMRSSATGSRSFLEDQERSRRAELAEVEGAIETYLTRAGAVDLDSEGQAAVAQVAEIDAQVEGAVVDLATTRTQLASLRRQLAQIEPNLEARIASGADREIDALQARVAELEVQAADYYAADPTLRGDEARDPELARLRSRIDGMNGQIGRLSARYVGEVSAVGGASGSDATGLAFAGQLRREVAQTEVQVQGLEAKAGALRTRRASVEGRIRELPEQTIRLAQLRRQQAGGEQAYAFVVSRLQEARLAEASEPGYVEVVRTAVVPETPVEPRPLQNLILGTLLGLGLGIGLALLRHTTDQRIRSTSDLRETGQTVLAGVPSFASFVADDLGGAATFPIGDHEVDAVVAAGLHPFSPVTEAFRRVRTAVRFSAPDRTVRTLLVTSAAPGEGKSTMALGLAISSALAGQRVLYLDADLRKPTGHTRLGLGERFGLSDLLFQDAAPSEIDWEAYRFSLDGAAASGFYALTAGRRVPNPTELLASNRMRALVAAATEAFDLVIVDSAPVLPVSDSLELAAFCDAVLVVVRAGQTTSPALARAASSLTELGDGAARMIGVVLNDAPVERSYGGTAYGYGYGYGYGSGDGASVDWSTPAHDLPAGDSSPTHPSGDGATEPTVTLSTSSDSSR